MVRPLPGGRCWSSGGGTTGLYEGHIYFECNTGEDEIYILVATLFAYLSLSTGRGFELEPAHMSPTN